MTSVPDVECNRTSLLLAAKHGKVDVVNYLLSVGHEDETISLVRSSLPSQWLETIILTKNIGQ